MIVRWMVSTFSGSEYAVLEDLIDGSVTVVRDSAAPLFTADGEVNDEVLSFSVSELAWPVVGRPWSFRTTDGHRCETSMVTSCSPVEVLS